jgi:hypothetical protein
VAPELIKMDSEEGLYLIAFIDFSFSFKGLERNIVWNMIFGEWQ